MYAHAHNSKVFSPIFKFDKCPTDYHHMKVVTCNIRRKILLNDK